MKITYDEWIIKLNIALKLAGQTARVVEFGQQTLTLSNNTILLDNQFIRFKKRILNSKTSLWVNNIDNLLAGTVTEQEIKSQLSRLGGLAVQQQYPGLTRANLNTGVSWNAGTKGQKIGTMPPCTQEVKDKISLKNSGSGNGMYGIRMSAAGKEYRSQLIKDRILAGTFTPNSNNRNSHWESILDNKKFRSSWEALYQYFSPTAEYEKLRIRYNYQNSEYIYIVDFVDHIQKYVVEVKPIELCTGNKFNAKMVALEKWALQNGYRVILVTKEWFLDRTEQIDYNRFDINTATKIKGIYATSKKN